MSTTFLISSVYPLTNTFRFLQTIFTIKKKRIKRKKKTWYVDKYNTEVAPSGCVVQEWMSAFDCGIRVSQRLMFSSDKLRPAVTRTEDVEPRNRTSAADLEWHFWLWNKSKNYSQLYLQCKCIIRNQRTNEEWLFDWQSLSCLP